jgi:hypothetical protein
VVAFQVVVRCFDLAAELLQIVVEGFAAQQFDDLFVQQIGATGGVWGARDRLSDLHVSEESSIFVLLLFLLFLMRDRQTFSVDQLLFPLLTKGLALGLSFGLPFSLVLLDDEGLSLLEELSESIWLLLE